MKNCIYYKVLKLTSQGRLIGLRRKINSQNIKIVKHSFRDVAISVLSQADVGTFLVLPATLLLRGYDHVHEYQIIRENKIGWYLKVYEKV